MVNYPNGKKFKDQTSFNNTSNRGMELERDINTTNQYYLDTKKANIHKKPTPVTIVHVDYPARTAAKITEAYFKVPSTTDYNGVYRGKAIDFEAKECNSKTSFPLQSIHPHQISHLSDVIYHGAIAFVIFRFTQYGETYYVEAKKVVDFYNAMTRKSIPYAWFKENGIIIPYNYVKPVDFLKVIDELYFNKEDAIRG